MKQQARVAYYLDDTMDGEPQESQMDHAHFKGDITMSSYGVTLHAGGINGSVGKGDFEGENESGADYLIPWHSVSWVELAPTNV